MSEDGPWVDTGVLDDFARCTSAEVFRYAGSAHLFADGFCADYEPKQAEMLLERVRGFAGCR